jgi:hypothetical protein
VWMHLQALPIVGSYCSCQQRRPLQAFLHNLWAHERLELVFFARIISVQWIHVSWHTCLVWCIPEQLAYTYMFRTGTNGCCEWSRTITDSKRQHSTTCECTQETCKYIVNINHICLWYIHLTSHIMYVCRFLDQ